MRPDSMTDTHSAPRPIVLVILDGFGERAETADNAVRLARTPVCSTRSSAVPTASLARAGPMSASPGQMGNSEVGHLNLGAGRIAMMDISRIDNAVYDGSLAANR